MSFTSKIGSLASRAYGWSAAVARAVDQYFEYVTLLLPGNGTNGAQNNTFLDGSANNFTITRNGNTTQGTFSPFSQTGWGNYFNGSSQYLSTADNVAFTMGSGDFTIEYWTYFLGGSDLRVYGQFASSLILSTISFFGGNSSGNKVLNGVYSGTTGYTCTSTADMPTNQWVHIAFVRDGNTLRQYINGVQDGTSNVTGVSINDSSTQLSIGRVGEYAAQYWNGHISNFRIVKGRCVYPSGTTFNPPTAPLTRTTGGTNPPQGTECSLLTCQSNRFLDSNGVNTPASSPLTITPNGSPTVVAFSPFNPTASWSAATYGGSGYFDGSLDYLSVAASTSIDLASSDFTIECWAYPGTQTNAVDSVFGYGGFTTMLYRNGTTWSWEVGNGSSANYFTITATVTPNAWQHIALTRSGNTFTFWINGSSAGTNSTANAVGTASKSLTIGYNNTSPSAQYFTGYISNFRIVKGTAVYTSAFTPPTAPLTAITNTSLLLNFTNAGIYDATSKNDLETVGNAQISTAQSKFGGSSMSFDGNNDSLNGPSSTELDMGTGNWTVEGWINITTRTLNYPLIIGNNNGGFSAGAVAFTASNADSATYNDRFNLAVYDLGGTRLINATGTANATGTWYHFAVVRNGTNISIYRDGVSVASATVSSSLTINFGKNGVRIGGNNWDATQSYLNGYLQDLRITKGYARYTANFTAPTAAFPTL